MVKKKDILVDLTMLNQLHSGIGRLNYIFGKTLATEYYEKYNFTFLLPINLVGIFGEDVSYVTPRKWRKKFPILNRKYDLWHSTYQLSKFKPSPLTRNIILTIHDLNFMYEKEDITKKKQLVQIQKKVNESTIVTCISDYVVTEVNRFLLVGNQPVRRIYNGVEILSDCVGEMPAFLNKRPFIFAIGEIVPKKNFKVLLGLMELLPEIDLFICGIKDRDYAMDIETEIGNKGLKNVTLPGIISHENKVWLFQNCLAFAHPSLFEGFGLPVIEAMQFGKPVFISNCTSLPEIAGKFGFVWEHFDKEYMLKVFNEGINKISNNPSFVLEMQNYSRSFSTELWIKSYLELYDSLLS